MIDKAIEESLKSTFVGLNQEKVHTLVEKYTPRAAQVGVTLEGVNPNQVFDNLMLTFARLAKKGSKNNKDLGSFLQEGAKFVSEAAKNGNGGASIVLPTSVLLTSEEGSAVVVPPPVKLTGPKIKEEPKNRVKTIVVVNQSELDKLAGELKEIRQGFWSATSTHFETLIREEAPRLIKARELFLSQSEGKPNAKRRQFLDWAMKEVGYHSEKPIFQSIRAYETLQRLPAGQQPKRLTSALVDALVTVPLARIPDLLKRVDMTTAEPQEIAEASRNLGEKKTNVGRPQNTPIEDLLTFTKKYQRNWERVEKSFTSHVEANGLEALARTDLEWIKGVLTQVQDAIDWALK